MTEAIPLPIPVTILTGFLGAGKTSLLNHILHADHGLRVAVLVNDFGAINIDTQLVVGVEGETVSLANGCICCTIRDDLMVALLKLMARPDRPEYILIETSGVSDPAAVALTFLMPQLRPLIHVDSILTVIDAEQVRGLEGQNAVLALDQIGAADIVIINKVDLVSADELQAVRDWVRQISPQARLLETTHGRAPLELILGVGSYTPERLAQRSTRDVHVHEVHGEHGEAHEHDHDHHHAHDHQHDHSLVFNTWNFTSEHPFRLEALRKALKSLPVSIYRAKGVLFLDNARERRVVLHVVGSRIHITLGRPWDGEPPHSQLVLIGKYGTLDADALRRRFEACLAGNEDIASRILETLQKPLEWVREAAV